MKVEHLTVLGSSVVRYTTDILPQTIEHFKKFSTGKSITATIEQTPFQCKVTVQQGIAIFNISIGENLLFVNVCCFSKSDTEPAMLYVRDLVRGNPLFENTIIRQPTEPRWLYTVPMDIFTPLVYAQLAGEIEFYIYHAIYRGLK